MIKFEIRSLLNFSDVKNFLEETGTSLVAYSIFITILMTIFEANYIQSGQVYHEITIFLLFFIILFLGFFILAYSNKYDNYFVRIFGFIVFLFPLFFVTFLSNPLQQNLIQGGYILVMLGSIVLASFLMNAFISYIQHKFFKNSYWFAIICLLVAILLFWLIKTTKFVEVFAKIAVKIIPFSILPDLIQIIILGLEIGVFIGLVLAPSFAFIRKVLPNKKEPNISEKKT